MGRQYLEYLGSSNMDRNAEATDDSIFAFTGIIRRNFKNTSVTERKYLGLSLYFA